MYEHLLSGQSVGTVDTFILKVWLRLRQSGWLFEIVRMKLPFSDRAEVTGQNLPASPVRNRTGLKRQKPESFRFPVH